MKSLGFVKGIWKIDEYAVKSLNFEYNKLLYTDEWLE